MAELRAAVAEAGSGHITNVRKLEALAALGALLATAQRPEVRETQSSLEEVGKDVLPAPRKPLQSSAVEGGRNTRA